MVQLYRRTRLDGGALCFLPQNTILEKKEKGKARPDEQCHVLGVRRTKNNANDIGHCDDFAPTRSENISPETAGTTPERHVS